MTEDPHPRPLPAGEGTRGALPAEERSAADDWSIRPYQPGDEAQIVALFQQSFAPPQTEAIWRWKLRGRPWPTETEWLAVAGERIVGHYAGIPLAVQVDGQARPAICCCNVVTERNFRRRGILLELGAETQRQWAAGGLALVIGLPNEQWGSRTTGLGWQILFPLGWLHRPLRLDRVLADGRVPPPLAAASRPLGAAWNIWADSRLARRRDPLVQVRPVPWAGREFDTLWAVAGPTHRHAVVRDRAWVAWRFFDAPAFNYRVLLAERKGLPCGYLAYRLVEAPPRRIGCLADLFVAADDPGACAALVRAALRTLREQGADAAVAIVPPDSALHDWLSQSGFRRGQGAFRFGIVPLAGASAPAQAASLGDPRAWWLTGGDFDVI